MGSIQGCYRHYYLLQYLLVIVPVFLPLLGSFLSAVPPLQCDFVGSLLVLWLDQVLRWLVFYLHITDGSVLFIWISRLKYFFILSHDVPLFLFHLQDASHRSLFFSNVAYGLRLTSSPLSFSPNAVSRFLVSLTTLYYCWGMWFSWVIICFQ